LLYLVNAVCQLFLFNIFLGGSAFHAYGIDVLRGVVDLDSDWPTVGATRFPRVTMCDLKIRRLGNVHRYVLQCVLPINMLNEKIFLFFWFWFLIVASVTIVSLVTWIVQVAIPSNGLFFVTQHMRFAGKFGDVIEHKTELRNFVDCYLRRDGLAILFLMTRNTNTLSTTDFVASLWDNYFKQKTE
jgi:hypothetical protein